jgi:hypothetical protein
MIRFHKSRAFRAAVNLSVFSILLTTAPTLTARVGDTAAECDSRYGVPEKSNADLRTYVKGDLHIAVFFNAGICWKILYAHTDDSPLSMAARQEILSLYGEWKENEIPQGTIWTLDFKHLAAIIDNTHSDGSAPTKGLIVFDPRRDTRVHTAQQLKTESGLVTSADSSRPTLDLVQGTLKGVPLHDLTLDRATDLFGRPTAALRPPQESVDGHNGIKKRIIYADKGLTIGFKEDDSGSLTANDIEVYLIEQYEPFFDTHFLPFVEAISRGLSSNTKAKTVMATFKGAHTGFSDAEDLLAMVPGSKEFSDGKPLPPRRFINLEIPGASCQFYFDRETTFIEKIGVFAIKTPAPQQTPKP